MEKNLTVILDLNPSLCRDFLDEAELPGELEIKTCRTYPHFMKTVQKVKTDRALMFLPEKKRFSPSKIRQACLLLLGTPIHVITGECDEKSYLTYISSGITSIITPPFGPADIQSVMNGGEEQRITFNKSNELIKEGQVRLDFLIPSKLSRIVGVNRLVSFLTAEFGFPPEDYRVNLPMVMDEALSNAIIHGNNRDPALKVHVRIYISSSRIIVQVEDEGKGFDYDSIADPTDDEKIYNNSGRGIYIMREIMHRMEFKNGGRVIELEKSNKG